MGLQPLYCSTTVGQTCNGGRLQGSPNYQVSLWGQRQAIHVRRLRRIAHATFHISHPPTTNPPHAYPTSHIVSSVLSSATFSSDLTHPPSVGHPLACWSRLPPAAANISSSCSAVDLLQQPSAPPKRPLQAPSSLSRDSEKSTTDRLDVSGSRIRFFLAVSIRREMLPSPFAGALSRLGRYCRTQQFAASSQAWASSRTLGQRSLPLMIVCCSGTEAAKLPLSGMRLHTWLARGCSL